MILILIFGDNSKYSTIALLVAFIHEAGHIIAAYFLKMKFDSFSINLFKFNIGIALPMHSYKKELLLSLAGPAANLLSGIIAIHIYVNFHSNEFVIFGAVASFFLAILNLMPIKDFDGGRIFICLLAPKFNLYTIECILDVLSFSLVLFLWIVSIYLMLRIGASLTLFIFSSSLFTKLFLYPDSLQK
jgi:stage IV sporulation protein FB